MCACLERIDSPAVTLNCVALELVQETSQQKLLQRIAAIACEQIGAVSALTGLIGKDHQLEAHFSVNTPKEDIRWADILHEIGGVEALCALDKPVILPLAAAGKSGAALTKNPAGADNLLVAPIRYEGELLGGIFVDSKTDSSPFTNEDQQTLQTIASYAAIAITNAAVFQRLTQCVETLTRRNKNLALLNELGSNLITSTDIDQILDKALVEIMDYLCLEAGEVFLRLEDSRQLKLVSHKSQNIERLWKKTKYRFGEGIVGQTAQSGRPCLINVSELTEDNDLTLEEFNGNLQQLVCFPLTGMRGVWGVLCAAANKDQELDELSLQFLSSLCMWLGTLIENIRLNLQQRRQAVLEERERIGMDLHDGVIQSIYAVGLTLEHCRLLMRENTQLAAKRIEQAIDGLNGAIRDMRAYILDLRPRQLHNENLIKGIQRLISEFRINTLVDVNFKGSWEDLMDIPDAQATALFHICQEALANIAKHAQAREVEVKLWTTNDRAYLEIRDDGKGFSTHKVKMTLGHGLSNMQTRAYNAGGDVEFISSPGSGTIITAWVPFLNEKFTYE